MDDATHFAAKFCLDRHNKPATAHADNRILQIFLRRGRLDHPLQPVTDIAFGGANLAANVQQRVTCRICHFGIRQNGFNDAFRQRRVFCDGIEQIIQHPVFFGAGGILRRIPRQQRFKVAQCVGKQQ
ncbi:hypothetical protein SDC9_173651 [bioreactor metagenome]|uniref:Uncharacterized protein n=1 Tax=bioreactor metagenome TaxID=1076179 RepID=A0A645GH10_9ZZZZ